MTTRTFLALVLASASLGWTAGGCRSTDLAAPDALALAASVSAQASSGLAHPERPFTVEAEGLASYVPREEGRCRTMDVPIVTASAGTGTATHLGHFEFSSSHCFEMPAGAPPPYGLLERGEWTFVAANGDELYAQYEGEQLTPLFDNPTLFTSEMIITGGTGRFTGATGWAHGEGRVVVPASDTDPWPLYLKYEGRISY